MTNPWRYWDLPDEDRPRFLHGICLDVLARLGEIAEGVRLGDLSAEIDGPLFSRNTNLVVTWFVDTRSVVATLNWWTLSEIVAESNPERPEQLEAALVKLAETLRDKRGPFVRFAT